MGKQKNIRLILYYIVSYIIYRLTLDCSYVYAIAPYFEYQHFVVVKDVGNYVFSLVWLVLISLFDYRLHKCVRPSSSFMWFFDLLFFVPLTSMAGLAGFSKLFIVYAFVFWVLSALFYDTLPRYRKRFSPGAKKTPDIVLIILGTVVVINFFITVYYNGFKIKFDLEDIYDIRLGVREMHLPTIVGYIKPMATQFLIILLCLSIIHKQYLFTAILTVIQLSSFAFGALKVDLFILLAAFAIGFFYNERRRIYIPVLLIASNIVVIIENNLVGFSSVAAIFHRRMLYMPSLLSSEYFSFFSTHEALYLRDSFLRFFGLSTPYSMEAARLIGYELYDSVDMNANTGIVGDDFAQLRWYALLVYPFLRVKLLQVFDYCSRGLNEKVLFLLAFSFSLSFISGSLFSILLTGGFIAVCIVLYLWRHSYRRKRRVIKIKKYKNNEKQVAIENQGGLGALTFIK